MAFRNALSNQTSNRKRFAGRLAGVVALMVLALAAPKASAAGQQDDNEGRDGRLEGFATKEANGQVAPVNVALEKSGSGSSYILFGLVTIISLGVLFKDPKRSHLD